MIQVYRIVHFRLQQSSLESDLEGGLVFSIAMSSKEMRLIALFENFGRSAVFLGVERGTTSFKDALRKSS